MSSLRIWVRTLATDTPNTVAGMPKVSASVDCTTSPQRKVLYPFRALVRESPDERRHICCGAVLAASNVDVAT
eukprot:3904808-Pleurochrysis_carterae.AAC.1